MPKAALPPPAPLRGRVDGLDKVALYSLLMQSLKKISNLFKRLSGEERQHPRLFLRFPVEIKLESMDQFLSEYISDISAGGIFIATDKPFERGSIVDIEFSLKEEAKHFFKVRGVVVRVHDEESGHSIRGMGIKFIEITEQSRDLMRDLLERITPNALPQ